MKKILGCITLASILLLSACASNIKNIENQKNPVKIEERTFVFKLDRNKAMALPGCKGYELNNDEKNDFCKVSIENLINETFEKSGSEKQLLAIMDQLGDYDENINYSKYVTENTLINFSTKKDIPYVKSIKTINGNIILEKAKIEKTSSYKIFLKPISEDSWIIDYKSVIAKLSEPKVIKKENESEYVFRNVFQIELNKNIIAVNKNNHLIILNKINKEEFELVVLKVEK